MGLVVVFAKELDSDTSAAFYVDPDEPYLGNIVQGMIGVSRMAPHFNRTVTELESRTTSR